MEGWLTPHILRTGTELPTVPLPKQAPLTTSGLAGGGKEIFIGSSPDCDVVITEPGWDARHLSLKWSRSMSTWVVKNLSDAPLVVDNVSFPKDRGMPLLLWDSNLFSEGVVLRFQRHPDAPQFQGRQAVDIPLTRAGLVIGRGQKSKDGDERPRLCLDPEMASISSMQAEIVWKDGGHVLANLNAKKSEWRTVHNGNQNFDQARLVLGDCIQMPTCREYYTFRFTGSGLRYIGSGGILQGENLSVVVPAKNEQGTKTILNSVSIEALRGNFLGIIGGSGQGKSTLLNALSGLIPPTAGAVSVDGRPIRSHRDVARAGIGYVPQDDIVHRDLTVDEALWFAARMRVSSSRAQASDLIDSVLHMLGLKEYRGQKIDDLSGGQRKRVSIASELLVNPDFIFLDEPTSGLDPLTENEIMGELAGLARSRRTGIICTTHVLQNANLMQRIAVISRGRLIFHGRTPDASRFILGTGRHERPGVGRSSYSTSSGTARDSTASGTAAGSPKGENQGTDDYQLEKIHYIYGRTQPASKLPAEQDAEAEQWEQKYKASPYYLPPSSKADLQEAPRPPAAKKVPALKKLLLLLSRQWRLLASAKLNYLFLLLQAVAIGGLVGWVVESIELRMFLGLISVLWFGCNNAAQKVVEELPIFFRERVSGLGINTYLLSKQVFLSAVTLVQAAILFAVLLAAGLFFHPPDAEADDLPYSLRKDFNTEDGELGWLQKLAVWRKSFELDAKIKGAEGAGSSFEVDVAIPEEAVPGKPAAREDFQPMRPKEEIEREKEKIAREKEIELERKRKLHPPVPETWRGLLSWTALVFNLRDNILDSIPDPVDQAGNDREFKGWQAIVAWCLGLRLAAVCLAAIVGVSLGLAISSLVKTPTQAVMWVPLLMIPQILLGAVVVTLPEMAGPVREFSSVMPSFSAERICQTSLIYGQARPAVTNQTKVPGFVDAEQEVVIYKEINKKGKEVEVEQKYDRSSRFNNAWQSLGVNLDRVGQREIETKPGKDELVEPKTVDTRSDLRIWFQKENAIFTETNLAAQSAIGLGCWLLGCYVLGAVSLKNKRVR